MADSCCESHSLPRLTDQQVRSKNATTTTTSTIDVLVSLIYLCQVRLALALDRDDLVKP